LFVVFFVWVIGARKQQRATFEDSKNSVSCPPTPPYGTKDTFEAGYFYYRRIRCTQLKWKRVSAQAIILKATPLKEHGEYYVLIKGWR